MDKALIIGGSGFIGRHLCRQLIAAGYQPVVFDRVPSGLPGVEYHCGDMVSVGDLWRPMLENVKVVFHLAWSTKPQSANDAPYYDLQTNVLAGIHFLDCLIQLENKPRVIFISSGGAVYGQPLYLPINEKHPTNPINAYGIGKLAYENYLALYRRMHGLDYLVFRPGNPYGEGQDPKGSQGVIAVFMGKMLSGEPISVWGDGGVVRDYLYVGDLVDAFIRSIDYMPLNDFERVFNIGSGEGVSLKQLLFQIELVAGRSVQIHYQDSRVADNSEVILDASLVRERMGWSAKTTIEDGLRATWEWIVRRSI